MSTASVSIEELLQTTSRTFALSIPLLPKPLDHEVTLAYLVFRIADTIEDADRLNRDERCEALHQFHDILLRLPCTEDATQVAEIANWSERFSAVSENDDYNRLVAETNRVLRLVSELDASARLAIQRNARRSVMGMRETLHRADIGGNLTLTSVDQLRQYCYYVAGIVGEMITELFLRNQEDRERRDTPLDETDVSTLHRTAAAFGEALQLVNILKDSGDDAICGRSYLPPTVPREQIHALADQRIADAERYVQALRNIAAAPGVIAFCDAPLQLAKRTLEVVAQHGPGSKVTRDETFALLQVVMERAGFAT